MLAKDRVVVLKLWITGIDCDLGCFMQRLLQVNSMKNCRDWAFSNIGLEAGLPAFQLPMLAKCDALPKKDLCIFMRHVCLRNPCFCGNLSLHSLPEAWGPWELQHAPPPHYGCIMVASCLQKIELWYPSFGLQVLIVISVVLYSERCKSVNNCRDWAFSNGGLEAGLPAFQLPMLAKCDALPKGDSCDMFVLYSDCCKSMNNCRDWAFSNNGLEVGLPAFQLPMFAKGDTLLKGDLCDMFV